MMVAIHFSFINASSKEMQQCEWEDRVFAESKKQKGKVSRVDLKQFTLKVQVREDTFPLSQIPSAKLVF